MRPDGFDPFTHTDFIYLYTCSSKSGGCISFNVVFYLSRYRNNYFSSTIFIE